MSDLIDRQAAIDALMEQFKRNTPIAIRAKLTVEGLPSAQPVIVMCKDCVKREHCRTSTVWAIPPKDDWFCADAEGRTE